MEINAEDTIKQIEAFCIAIEKQREFFIERILEMGRWEKGEAALRECNTLELMDLFTLTVRVAETEDK